METSEKCYTVYKHTSLSNKCYIGITKKKPETRWGKGNGYKGNIFFYRAICKYGWENILHEIMAFDLTKAEAETMEIKLIADFRSNDREFGYNIENGGNCCGTHSEETKRKIGEKSKGNKACLGRKISAWHIEQLRKSNIGSHRHVGSKRSEETKKKMSASLKGRIFTEEHKQHMRDTHADMSGVNNPRYGKKLTDETKQKIGNANRGRKWTQAQCDNLSKVVSRRGVYKLDASGDVIGGYSSLKAAAERNGLHSQNIGFCCKHKSLTAGGFRWRYADGE